MIRLAREGDEEVLRAFRCWPDPVEDEDAEEDEYDPDGVEHFFSTAAWEWVNDPLGDGHYLLIMEDDISGEIVGAAAHHGVNESGFFGRFVVALAISTLRQDNHLGRELLRATLKHCAERCPGAEATWLVRRSNERSVRMCESIDGTSWMPEPGSDGELLRFRFPLPSLG